MKPIDILTGGEHSRTIAAERCTGCGGERGDFRDELSEREYRISGFCQRCQDEVFGKLADEAFDPQNDMGGIYFGMTDDEIPGPGEDY